ncbi:hypothetical protein AgCh_038825 [Apium graveolens]
MNKTKLPIRKRLGNVPQFSGSVDAAVAERRWLELIKDYDYEILYHPGKAKMVANALSKKERLKMIMSLRKFLRDFEKMEREVKVTGAGTEKMFEIAIQSELSEENILCQKK